MRYVRTLALALLDDDNGISQEAYDVLLDLMLDSGDCGDIIPCIESTDGRYYLPEGWK